MPALESELHYLIASGAPSSITAMISSLPTAVQKEATLADLVTALRLQLAQTLQFRPAQENMIRLIAAMQYHRADLGISFPWSFSNPSSWGGIPGWEEAPNGPKRPTSIQAGLDSTYPLYINVSCDPITEERKTGPDSQTLTTEIELWQAVAGDLQLIHTGAASGQQIGPLPADTQIALTVIARDQFSRPSYPTNFIYLTPHN